LCPNCLAGLAQYRLFDGAPSKSPMMQITVAHYKLGVAVRWRCPNCHAYFWLESQ
jgi:hypothetical protein